MAFRRSSSSKGRFGRPRFSSRNRTHAVKKSGHWQRSNFSLIFQATATDENDPFNTVIVMAQIDDHLGDDSTAAGRVQTNQIRTLEIGGIVFDWQLEANAVPALEEESGADTRYAGLLSSLLLCTDRLTMEGDPTAIDVAWFTSTTSTPVASSTEQIDEDQRFPTRVHWRTSRFFDCGSRLPVNSLGPEMQPTGGRVVLAQGSKNLRLRLALSDEQALVFHWATTIPTGFLTETSYAGVDSTLFLNGSLYYRTRY